ncbi:hypothetical protein B7760_04394 [Burkholderia glumae]|nr:hypothetical protein B7760_04394 [Burkholderia glumae]
MHGFAWRLARRSIRLFAAARLPRASRPGEGEPFRDWGNAMAVPCGDAVGKLLIWLEVSLRRESRAGLLRTQRAGAPRARCGLHGADGRSIGGGRAGWARVGGRRPCGSLRVRAPHCAMPPGTARRSACANESRCALDMVEALPGPAGRAEATGRPVNAIWPPAIAGRRAGRSGRSGAGGGGAGLRRASGARARRACVAPGSARAARVFIQHERPVARTAPPAACRASPRARDAPTGSAGDSQYHRGFDCPAGNRSEMKEPAQCPGDASARIRSPVEAPHAVPASGGGRSSP